MQNVSSGNTVYVTATFCPSRLGPASGTLFNSADTVQEAVRKFVGRGVPVTGAEACGDAVVTSGENCDTGTITSPGCVNVSAHTLPNKTAEHSVHSQMTV